MGSDGASCGNTMKAKGLILSVLCAVAAVGVTIWLAEEHQARLRLGQENQALRQQLSRLAGLVAENERLSNILAQAKSPPSLPDERLKELLRLRGEAGVLRQQGKEIEALRQENRLARAKLESTLRHRRLLAARLMGFCRIHQPGRSPANIRLGRKQGRLESLAGQQHGRVAETGGKGPRRQIRDRSHSPGHG